MYISGNIPGCLVSLLIFLLSLYLLKELWWIIVGIALILIAAYWGRRIYLLLLEKKQQEKANYNPEMGEVYKICPYCNSKLKVTEVTCPNCGHALN